MQRVPQPTRDVLVTRDHAGEREFSGFGAAQNDEYADCFIDASQLPEDVIKASLALHSWTTFDRLILPVPGLSPGRYQVCLTLLHVPYSRLLLTPEGGLSLTRALLRLHLHT